MPEADDVASHSTDDEAVGVSAPGRSPPKKKQKRNKPTLSCSECVDRKTKCDRARPACLACVKRGSECRYSDIANLIASSHSNGRTSKSRKYHANNNKPSVAPVNTVSAAASPGLPTPISYKRSGSTSSSHSSPFLLSNVPHSRQPSASIFGISQEHPFANYWTTQGGIPEVVGVLPSREHADLLVAKYFETVDPVYPMLDRSRFYADYDRFWSLPLPEKQRADAGMLALQFAVYAMGAQFIQMESEQQKAQIAEFYVSAAHQSLRLYLFLSRTSIKSIQAMVLIAYFLMNDNKAADAWAFGGILLRQAYAMGLNRDPEIIAPHISEADKQTRRKLWQAVYFQDTFLTVLLKLPPTTTFADVTVDSLVDEPIEGTTHPAFSSMTPLAGSPAPMTSTPNPMSISSIAPQISSPALPSLSTTPLSSIQSTTTNDLAFIRSMWRLADLVQTTICVPRALSRPLTNSPRHKEQLLSQFHTLYASLPPSLTCHSPAFPSLLAASTRVARQNLFLRSNFWHCVMLIEADENVAGGVTANVAGALDAGRLAVSAFFDFWDGLRGDAGVWWVFQHRAFEEALTMAQLLASQQAPPTSPIDTQLLGGSAASAKLDLLAMEAKGDVRRALEILEYVASSVSQTQKTRTEYLRAAYEEIGS